MKLFNLADMILSQTPRGKIIEFIQKPVHQFLYKANPTPYIWGGQKMETGVDCSGFAILALQHAGLFPDGADDTANGLMNRYPAINQKDAQPGDLVFYGNSTKATHVGILYQRFDEDEWLFVEAGGGGSKHKDAEDSIADFAIVRPSITSRRKDLLGYGKVC